MMTAMAASSLLSLGTPWPGDSVKTDPIMSATSSSFSRPAQAVNRCKASETRRNTVNGVVYGVVYRILARRVLGAVYGVTFCHTSKSRTRIVYGLSTDRIRRGISIVYGVILTVAQSTTPYAMCIRRRIRFVNDRYTIRVPRLLLVRQKQWNHGTA